MVISELPGLFQQGIRDGEPADKLWTAAFRTFREPRARDARSIVTKAISTGGSSSAEWSECHPRLSVLIPGLGKSAAPFARRDTMDSEVVSGSPSELPRKEASNATCSWRHVDVVALSLIADGTRHDRRQPKRKRGHVWSHGAHERCCLLTTNESLVGDSARQCMGGRCRRHSARASPQPAGAGRLTGDWRPRSWLTMRWLPGEQRHGVHDQHPKPENGADDQG